MGTDSCWCSRTQNDDEDTESQSGATHLIKASVCVCAPTSTPCDTYSRFTRVAILTPTGNRQMLLPKRGE